MRVRNEHWEVLLTFCETYPELITNKYFGDEKKSQAYALWQNVALSLNALGFGEKSVAGWKKTLTDWKSKTKHKSTTISLNVNGTKDGQSDKIRLTSLEKRLLSLMGIKPVEGDNITELSFEEVSVLNTDIHPKPEELVTDHEYSNKSPLQRTRKSSESKSRSRKRKPNDHIELLSVNKKKVDVLHSLNSNLERIANGMERIADTIERIADSIL